LTSTSDKLSGEYLQKILVKAVENALDGTLTDTDRVALYRLALTIASAEFHRIASNGLAIVAPEAMLLLQQIILLCDPEVDAERLAGGMGLIEEKEEKEDTEDGSSQDEDVGDGVEDAG